MKARKEILTALEEKQHMMITRMTFAVVVGLTLVACGGPRDGFPGEDADQEESAALENEDNTDTPDNVPPPPSVR
jgi:hypothetical protein